MNFQVVIIEGGDHVFGHVRGNRKQSKLDLNSRLGLRLGCRLMALKPRSDGIVDVVETGHINTDVSFFILRKGWFRMLADTPLFWFEIEVECLFGRFWLIEYCVLWNGDRNIVEAVEIEEDILGYFQI